MKLPARYLLRRAVAICIGLAAALLSAVASAQALLNQDHPLAGKLWDMSSQRFIDEATLMARIKPADVVLLGETHDNPVHHRRQQELLRAKLAAGGAPALLMEQFNIDHQGELDSALARSDHDDALETIAGLAKGWDWAFYRPLLATAIERKLPVVAANLSRERMRSVIREGFAAYDPAEFKRLGIETVWNDGRQRYLTEVIEAAHCGQIDNHLRDGMVRAQRLRDAVMADAALAALSNLKRGVVAIVGRGHARRDVGLPLYLAARQPGARIYSIGLVEVSPDKTSPQAYEPRIAGEGVPFDVLWFSPRAERPDPCAAFAKR
jgi:uncharacterized iron-regulated protein